LQPQRLQTALAQIDAPNAGKRCRHASDLLEVWMDHSRMAADLIQLSLMGWIASATVHLRLTGL
jgi:hypothetical protein